VRRGLNGLLKTYDSQEQTVITNVDIMKELEIETDSINVLQ